MSNVIPIPKFTSTLKVLPLLVDWGGALFVPPPPPPGDLNFTGASGAQSLRGNRNVEPPWFNILVHLNAQCDALLCHICLQGAGMKTASIYIH